MVWSSRHRLAACVAWVAGALSIALLLASLVPPPTDPNQPGVLSPGHRAAFAGFAALMLAWSVWMVPFAAVLAEQVKGRQPALASAAQLLCAAGALLLGFGVFVFMGAVLSLASAGPGVPAEIVAHHVRFWSHLRFYLTDPGLMAWGLGQLLFAGLTWHERTWPRWLCGVGFVGGAAGVLTLAVYETEVLALLQLLAFAVWACALGVRLWRDPARPGAAP